MFLPCNSVIVRHETLLEQLVLFHTSSSGMYNAQFVAVLIFCALQFLASNAIVRTLQGAYAVVRKLRGNLRLFGGTYVVLGVQGRPSRRSDHNKGKSSVI